MDTANRNRIKVPFGDLALQTAFTMNGYFTFIFMKVGNGQAEQVGCSDPDERYVTLEPEESVCPVFLPQGRAHDLPQA